MVSDFLYKKDGTFSGKFWPGVSHHAMELSRENFDREFPIMQRLVIDRRYFPSLNLFNYDFSDLHFIVFLKLVQLLKWGRTA